MIIIIKKILRKNQYGEYRIVEYHNFKIDKNYTYYTDDLQDLDATCNSIIHQYETYYNYHLCGKGKNKCSETYILMKGDAR